VALSISILVLAGQSLRLAPPALASDPTTITFSSTGAEQPWTVPSGVSALHVILVGAPGGASPGGGTVGGRGDTVEGDLAVSPGDTLYLEVGASGRDAPNVRDAPPNPATFNGGGAGGACSGGYWGASGGGATDIRTTPRSPGGEFDSRLVVAAGGGGAGDVGDGGDAGQAGSGPRAGGGATTSLGGAGGTGDVEGIPGLPELGGAGASSTACGAGGGGGLYGGGGGGASSSDRTQGGAGGGGSSSAGGASNPSITSDATGIPSITITYDAGPGPTPSPADNATVHAQFSVTAGAACLELSTTSIDFGSVDLGDEDVAGAPDITITSCSGASEALLAHGTDAHGTTAAWSLVGGSARCADTLGLDNYRMQLASNGATVGLSTSDASLGTLAPGAASTQTARMTAACPGSSGAGQVMTTQIVFLATTGG
jgi:hypothetical protein